MQFYTLLCFVFLTITYGFSQNINGTVFDKLDKSPMPGATITLDNTKSVLSDKNGEFTISVSPGKHTLLIKYMGYASQTIEVNLKAGEEKPLNIYLETEEAILNVVVVSASQYEKKVTNETVSMDVIGKNLLKNVNAVQLGDILTKSPGVQNQDGQISIRGGSSYSYGVGTRTAVLVDGLSYVSGDLGDAQLKFAPIEMADQIEIIKGAASVVYGSSALNGVVNMRTGWPTEKSYTEATQFVNFYGNPRRKEIKWWGKDIPYEAGLSILHKQKFGNLSLVASGNFYHFDSYLTGADETRGRIAFKTKYIPAKVAGLTMGIDYSLMYESSDRFFLSQDLDTNIYKVSNNSGDRYMRMAIDPHIVYIAPKNNRISYTARFLNVHRFGSGTDLDAVSWVFTGDLQHQKTFTFRGDKKFILTTGIPYTVTTNVSNLFASAGRLTTWNIAAYLQGELKWNKLSAIVGGRYELQKQVFYLEKFSPVFRVGLNYEATKSTFIRASWGQGYRIPSLAEKYLNANLNADVFVFPNRDLQTEKSWNAEIGVKQALVIKKNWKGLFDFSMFLQDYTQLVEYSLGIYHNRYDDGTEIFPGKPEYLFGFKAFNVDRARIFGYEASLMSQGKIGPITVNTLIGYTYNFPGNATQGSTNEKFAKFMANSWRYAFTSVDSSDYSSLDSLGRPIFNILQYRTRHMIRLDVEFQYKKFMLGYALNYNSAAEVVPPQFYIVFSQLDGGKGTLQKFLANTRRGALIMDMRLGYEVTNKLRFTFIIKNFTNRLTMTRIGRADPPINFTLQARYIF